MPSFSNMLNIRVVLAGFSVLWLLTACGSSGPQVAAERAQLAVDAYFQALEDQPGSEQAIDQGLERFALGYEDLAADDLGTAIDEIYAESLFFNDTVHTFTDRETLKAYMIQTGANLTESEVEIHQVLRDGPDVFVRWTMFFQIGEGEDAIRSNSIGISHLRFDDKGQVVLHQDYWDSANALYSHLPIVGFVVRAAQDRLATQ